VTPPRILIVDDEPDLADLVSESLNDFGFEAHARNSLSSALDALHSLDFALVVSDFDIGPGHSWEALEALRAEAAPAPIGIVSGWKLDLQEVKERGFAFFLSKPVELEEYLAVIGQHCQLQPVAPAHERQVREYFRILGEKRWSDFERICTPQVSYHLPGQQLHSKSLEGVSQLQAFSAQTFEVFRDARFEVQSIYSLGTAVVARYHGFWRTSDNQPGELPGSVIFGFEGDRISRIGVRLQAHRLTADRGQH
jgi:CheY-like chemotaxis protein